MVMEFILTSKITCTLVSSNMAKLMEEELINLKKVPNKKLIKTHNGTKDITKNSISNQSFSFHRFKDL